MLNTGPARDSRRTSEGFRTLQVYGAIGTGMLLCGILMRHADLTIDPFNGSSRPYLIGALVAAAVRVGTKGAGSRRVRALGNCAEYYALFTATCLTGAVASYPIAAMTHGYADPLLQRIDTMLHFDWLTWYRTVAQHRWLQLLGTAAYESIYVSPAVLLGWFALHEQREEAHRFLIVFWLTAVMTLSLFSLMPAVGPFSYLWHGPFPYMPVSELWQPDLIPLLRAHAVHLIDLGQLRGLVSAPSFHTAAAFLYISTAWSIPRLRWPLLAMNITMLLSTPVEGTHYLTDMILGAAVALTALMIVRQNSAGSRGSKVLKPRIVLISR